MFSELRKPFFFSSSFCQLCFFHGTGARCAHQIKSLMIVIEIYAESQRENILFIFPPLRKLSSSEEEIQEIEPFNKCVREHHELN